MAAPPPLTSEQQSTYNALSEMGFTSIQSKHAAIRFGSKTEEAINWLFENPDSTLPDDFRPSTPNDEPPPLISIDDRDDLPHPSTIGMGGRRNDENVAPPTSPHTATTDLPPAYDSTIPSISEKTSPSTSSSNAKLLPAHYIPPSKPDIDLTRDENYPFYPSTSTQQLLTNTSHTLSSKEDQDLQRAIQESTSLNTSYASGGGGGLEVGQPGGGGGGGGGGGEDDLDKALKLSMASLGSQEGDQPELSSSVLDSIPAIERLRDSLETPVLLRSNSPLMSSLSSYLQCLYSIQSWRNHIMGWRRRKRKNQFVEEEGEGMLVDFGQDEVVGEEEEGEGLEGFEGYWKGDGSLGGFGGGSEEEQRLNRIRSVQRLFAVMHDSRRKFVHVREVVKAFGLRESEFHYQSGVPRILDLHKVLLQDLMEEGEKEEVDKKFIVRGRKVLVDEWIGNPLPPIEPKDQMSSHVLELEINPSAEPPQTLFERLDSLLLNVGERIHNASIEEFHLLTSPHPSTLLFSFARQTTINSLDNFASSSGTGGRKVFQVEKEIWLDRYYVRKRKEIKENWDALRGMRKEYDEVKEKKRKLETFEKDGRDAVGIVRGAVEYLEGTKEIVEGEEVDEERRARQGRMRESYGKILKHIEQKLEEYGAKLASLESTMSSLFDSPSWRTLGPYHLTSILVRNGLNGRGSVWSITKGDDGKWFRTNDMTIDEISIEEVNKVLTEDKTGLFLDAGVSLAFYQLEGAEEFEREVPVGLSRAIARDNHTFSGELLSSAPSLETHQTISSWNLPPLSSLPLPPPPQHTTHAISFPRRSSSEEEAIPITIDSAINDEDDPETVQNISLSPPPPETTDATARMSVDPEKVEDDEEELEPLIPEDSKGGGEGGEDEEMLSQPQMTREESEDVALRLRGGANTDSEEEEEEDEDYLDEDEVELGLLEPMPKNRDEWDIDYKVGKIGGLPIWLDPRAPLDADQVACGLCEKTMSLLLQVNSPDDTRPHAAARSLYVFACRSKGCVTKDSKKALRVWRTQMESPNEFFPHTEESIAKRKELEIELDEKTQLKGTIVGAPKPWSEWDVAAEPEPYEESYLPDPSAPAPEQDTEGDDANADDTVSGVDKEFLAFQERIEREPRQVLRFYRLPDIETPEPLWTSSKKIESSDVPPCELCRGPREVEFQVLSTLLSHLKDDTLEFDSLLVYTCLDNCEIPPQPPLGDKTGWKEEVIFKQDFTSSGVRFGLAN